MRLLDQGGKQAGGYTPRTDEVELLAHLIREGSQAVEREGYWYQLGSRHVQRPHLPGLLLDRSDLRIRVDPEALILPVEIRSRPVADIHEQAAGDLQSLFY